ncbi:DUF4013 domain-containing protein [Chloroflexota bacterium]
MDIGKAIGFVFDDEEWIAKMLIAAVILLLGITFAWLLLIPLILALLLLGGYGVEITRRVIFRETPVLPRWDDWGDLLGKGLKVWVIGVVYALPIIIVGICLSIPIGILGESAQDMSAVLSVFMSCLNFLWSLLVSLLLPAAIALYVVDGDIGAAFRFGDVFALVRDNFSIYLVVLVVSWVASLLGSMGFIFCLIPGLFTAPYAAWVTSHLYGQAYLEATGRPSAPVFEEEPA